MQSHALITLSMLTIALGGARASAQGVVAGEKAPPITIEHLVNAPDDASIDNLAWSDLPHDTVLLEFWGTWCAPCVAAIPHLNELHDEFSDEMTFLSVTYEAPDVINRFTDARPIKSWIGCDTDKSMPDAYGISGWPTTFIIRDGVVVARTHPSTLEAEQLRRWLDGESDSPVREAQEPATGKGETVGADGRPPVGPFIPGRDPHTRVDDHPMFQLIVREAGESQTHGTGGGGATHLGATIRNIVSSMWNLPIHSIRGDDAWLDGNRYDVIYAVPQSKRDTYMPIVRDLTMEALGFDLTMAEERVAGYALRPGPEGVTLPDAVTESAGWSTQSGDGSITITSTSLSMDSAAQMVGFALRAPVVNEVDSDNRYFVRCTLDITSPEALRASLEEQCGLTLVETEVPTQIANVKRAGDEEQPGPIDGGDHE